MINLLYEVPNVKISLCQWYPTIRNNNCLYLLPMFLARKRSVYYPVSKV